MRLGAVRDLCYAARPRLFKLLRHRRTASTFLDPPWPGLGPIRSLSSLPTGSQAPASARASTRRSPDKPGPVSHPEGLSTWISNNQAMIGSVVPRAARLPSPDGATEDPASRDLHILLDPVAGILGFGRWTDLSMDHKLLQQQCTPPGNGPPIERLIDRSDTQKDMRLWACLLSFCYRTNDRSGTSYLLAELFRRRQIYQTSGLGAVPFWDLVLNISIHDDSTLTSLLEYAEWMRTARGAVWPGLYSTVVSHCLSAHQPERAKRWHLHLMPAFDPGPREFCRILEGAISDPDPVTQDLLKCLYVTSRHRDLYDSLIPFLWDQGHSNLARSWRTTLVNNNDQPRTHAAHAFLRHMLLYFPELRLTQQERAATNRSEMVEKEGSDASTAKSTDNARGEGEPQPEVTELSNNLQNVLNNAFGQTHGIGKYNDRLGAKLFASSWVPLDMAFSLVQALGVQAIGPLSLQSIALREDSPRDVKDRLDQLQRLGIGVGGSTYAEAVRFFANNGDSENLEALLHSDIHPDVFDDFQAQRKVLSSCARTGEWTPYRVIVAVRASQGPDVKTITFNDMVVASIHLNQRRDTLKLLDDMKAGQIPLFPETSTAISRYLWRGVIRRREPAPEEAHFAIAIGRRLMDTPYPLPARAWNFILISLLRMYKFDEMESLAKELITRYLDAQTSDKGAMMSVHIFDLPRAKRKRGETPNSLFQSLPRDLSLFHRQHPIHRVFDGTFQRVLIRRTMREPLIRRGTSRWDAIPTDARQTPADFYVARGVRLLAMLTLAGLNVDVELVRTALLKGLRDLFGYDSTPRKPVMKTARQGLRLSMADARDLFNDAWRLNGRQMQGGKADLLPPIDELQKQVDVAALNKAAVLKQRWSRKREEAMEKRQASKMARWRSLMTLGGL